MSAFGRFPVCDVELPVLGCRGHRLADGLPQSGLGVCFGGFGFGSLGRWRLRVATVGPAAELNFFPRLSQRFPGTLFRQRPASYGRSSPNLVPRPPRLSQRCLPFEIFWYPCGTQAFPSNRSISRKPLGDLERARRFERPTLTLATYLSGIHFSGEARPGSFPPERGAQCRKRSSSS
jgi:hypothetical protein